jgi:hypothetical protein
MGVLPMVSTIELYTFMQDGLLSANVEKTSEWVLARVMVKGNLKIGNLKISECENLSMCWSGLSPTLSEGEGI